MIDRLRVRRLSGSATAAIALYAFFLLVSQFEHHDFLCHLRTPQHCTTCAASVVGSDPHADSAPGAAPLADAGRAVSIELPSTEALLAVRTTGRSPPASR
jgi:hypothetical protein